MSFIEEVKNRAKSDIKTIILPEATDIRVLKATETVIREGYAKIILIGNEEEIVSKAKENNINIKGATIIDPMASDNREQYANTLYELRRNKGSI